MIIIISITKFLILVLRASICHIIDVRSRSISTFSNWIPVIGQLHHSHVNHVHFNVFFFFAVSLLFAPVTFSLKKRGSLRLLKLEICY